MVPDDVRKNLAKLTAKGIRLKVGGSASAAEVQAAKARLGLDAPARALSYWTEINGLAVEDPSITILELAKLECDQLGFVRFALLEKRHWLALDTRNLNRHGDWSIVNPETEYRLAGSTPSFWSIHIWHWLLRRRPIWYDVHTWQRAADSIAIPVRGYDNERYAIVIEPTSTGFSAHSPDFLGCISTGDTEEETRRNFREAVLEHVQVLAAIS